MPRGSGRRFWTDTRAARRYSTPVGAVLWVCLGGAVGSGGRYLIAVGAGRLGIGFPVGTLAVNLLGSFVLAALLSAAEIGGLRPELRLFLGTGLLGGFTTYSTFNLEVVRMFETGEGTRAAAYLAGTVLGALAFGLAGAALGRSWARG